MPLRSERHLISGTTPSKLPLYIGIGSPALCPTFAVHRWSSRQRASPIQGKRTQLATANLRTKILDFRGFDSSRILISWVGILRSIGYFPESFSQRTLVGIILVGRLGLLGMPEGLTGWLARWLTSWLVARRLWLAADREP